MRIDDSTLIFNTNPQQNPFPAQNIDPANNGKGSQRFSFEECLRSHNKKTVVSAAEKQIDYQAVGIVMGNCLLQSIPPRLDLKSKTGAYQSISEL